MRYLLTFDPSELSSTLTSVGYKLHTIASNISYFKQYAKLHGVSHDFLSDDSIENINEITKILKYGFALPVENNSCLEYFDKNHIEKVIEEVNHYHRNPRITIGKLQDVIRSAYAIADREGKDTNWEGFKEQCKHVL